MQAEDILIQADALFAAGRGQDAADLLESAYRQAKQEKDWRTQLTLVNELMGWFRARGDFSRAQGFADAARALLAEQGLSQTLAGMTTLLNIATLRRSQGQPEAALALYAQVEQVYVAAGLRADCRLGGLYNNMAVSWLELGQKQQALDYAHRAAAALKGAEDSAGARATVWANLASVLLRLDPPALDEAETYLQQALTLFETEAPADPHYSGALAGRAFLAFRRGDVDGALALYRQAMEITRRAFGENRDYRQLAANAAALEKLRDRGGQAGQAE